jgi:hypothetical protein
MLGGRAGKARPLTHHRPETDLIPGRLSRFNQARLLERVSGIGTSKKFGHSFGQSWGRLGVGGGL